MSFAERWRNYRIDKLNLSSKEVAYSLGVKPAAYSNYELEKRPFPADLLLKLQPTFGLTDNQMLTLLKSDPQKRTHLSEDQIQHELATIRNRYLTQLGEDLLPFITNQKELLSYITLLKNQSFSAKERRMLLVQAIKSAEQQLHKGK